MIAIMGENAMIEVAHVLRFSFLNDFAEGALVAVGQKILRSKLSSYVKITIGRRGWNNNKTVRVIAK